MAPPLTWVWKYYERQEEKDNTGKSIVVAYCKFCGQRQYSHLFKPEKCNDQIEIEQGSKEIENEEILSVPVEEEFMGDTLKNDNDDGYNYSDYEFENDE